MFLNIVILLILLIVYGSGELQAQISNPINPGDLPWVDDFPLPRTGGLYGYIGQIINWLLGFVGLILFFIILYSGFEYMTAGADTEKTKRALQRVKNALIGLLIISLSWVISGVILNFFFGEDGLRENSYQLKEERHTREYYDMSALE